MHSYRMSQNNDQMAGILILLNAFKKEIRSLASICPSFAFKETENAHRNCQN